MTTFMASADSAAPGHVETRWHIIDADGQVLGRLATRVEVILGRRSGRIVVRFGSPEDLERLVAAIAGPDQNVPTGARP